MKELDNILDNGFDKNIYMIFGEEDYLVDEYEKKFEKKLIENKDDITDYDFFVGNKTEPVDVFNAVSTLSFTTNKRFIKVKESDLFFRGRSDASENMLNFIKEMPQTDDYILLFVENKVDKRSKLYKQIQKLGKIFEFKALKDVELSNMALSFFQERNNTIEKGVLEYFIRTVSYSLTNIHSEVEKLSDYKPNGKITKEDIDEVCTKSLEVKIFDLVKAIGNKDIEKALSIYENMIIMKESPIMILTMIGRQIKIILECKDLSSRRLSQNEICERTGLRSFIVKDCINQSKNFGKLDLYNAYKEIQEMDVKIKTGQIKDTIALEIIICKYAEVKR